MKFPATNLSRRVLLSALAIVLFCGLVSISILYFTSEFVVYRGDGTFTDSSGMRGPFYVRGYEIAFPDLNLNDDQVQETRYKLAGLPSIDKVCGVYLAIKDRDWKLRGADREKIGGRFEFELTNSQKKVVAKASGALADYIWAEGGKYELYQMDNSFFTPSPQEEYILRCRFLTDAQLKGMRGYVWLRCGGSL